MYTLSDLRLRIGETSNYYLTPTKSEKINSEYIYLHTFNNVLKSCTKRAIQRKPADFILKSTGKGKATVVPL